MAKVVGEIVAVDWDSNDDPSEICLQAEGERYTVEHGESFQELLGYVGCEVEVDGYVEENDEGENILQVRDFEVLDTLDDEKESEDDAEVGDDEKVVDYVDEEKE